MSPLIMNDYELQRQEKIKRNKALIQELGLPATSTSTRRDASKPPPLKWRRLQHATPPSRVSARIAATPAKPQYDEDEHAVKSKRVSRKPASAKQRHTSVQRDPAPSPAVVKGQDVEELKRQWASWEPTGPAPIRDDLTGMFDFGDWPSFTPNKSPAEMLHEGVFGGSYFRALYSKRLGVTVEGDWRELPRDWIQGLSVGTFLTSPSYDAEVNKYKAKCGQSIEEWEENGWIDHQCDVRGWFQWYCRFFQGRRCHDDERQIGRWARCVGPRGRWRRALLKKYGQLGIRSVMADMDDGDGDEDKQDVSPTVHQTCLQWGFEVRQSVLDEFWANG